jgi:hypothetical protein
MKRIAPLEITGIAPLEIAASKNPNDETPDIGAHESRELSFLNELNVSILKDNRAFFYHPKASGVKSILQKALTKNNIQIKEENHFLCNYRNVLEVADKIIKNNFNSVFYILDHSTADVFHLHKTDKLFLAISEKFENISTIIINNNTAYIYE